MPRRVANLRSCVCDIFARAQGSDQGLLVASIQVGLIKGDFRKGLLFFLGKNSHHIHIESVSLELLQAMKQLVIR